MHRAIAHIPQPFHPRLPPPCHTAHAPAAGWAGERAGPGGGKASGGLPGRAAGRWRRRCTGRFRWQQDHLATDDRPSQPPDKFLPPGPTSAGRLSGWGWKRACGGRSCGCGAGEAFTRRWPGVPALSTQHHARAGTCHPPLIAAHVRAAGKRHATACRMRTSSGDNRAAHGLRHPYSLSPEAKPACGPPDWHGQIPAEFSRGNDHPRPPACRSGIEQPGLSPQR